MPDIISKLHKGTNSEHLFESVKAGKYILSIQASHAHMCWPRVDNLPPYMYDTFEVMIYGPMKRRQHGFIYYNLGIKNADCKGRLIPNMSKQALQRLYDFLCEGDST